MLKYRFRPGLLPTLAMLLAVALCIRLGLWQQHKAGLKQALQTRLDQRLREAPVVLPEKIAVAEAWRYRRVKARGSYDPHYQILLDNQVENEVAGFHVLTPLLLENGTRVLVDRGWIPAPADHATAPEVVTPAGMLEVEGTVWLPSDKIFTLAPAPSSSQWQSVWQNLDMKRYAQAVPFAVLPVVIRLDAASGAGGFVRDWPRPAENIEMHVGYTYQWFGFALAFVVIYLVVNIRKSDE
ncbi:SURF1 family protein [mine drainage metagenome]|uniref:SURF1 family protein n=1 Tax=mine drainage metagenome TaxID=410659 RepID=A0A1J5R346_9ZZZZ